MMKRLLLLMMTLVLLAGQARCLADDALFHPEMLEGCTFAEMYHRATGQTVHLNSEYDLNDLASLLVCAEETSAADCLFDAELALHLADGRTLLLQIATDDCSVYRVNGRDYRYGRNLVSDPASSPDSSVLFTIFNMDAGGNFAEDHYAANAWTFGDAPMYRNPGDAEPIAVLPGGVRVLWLSTTQDYAFGCIETVVNERPVQGYVPWLNLQAYNTGTERELALRYLKSELGWTQAELEDCQLYVPMTAQRNQFCCVTVISRTHPAWRYEVWLDYLSGGGLHDIQTPFTGSLSPDEKTFRMMLRSGEFQTAEAIHACFLDCYGPEESWSPALAEWATYECQRLARSGAV